MKRPVAWAGFAIMAVAVLIGFQPTLPSILLLFATTLLGGHYIKKNASESYDGFVKFFGVCVAVFNFIAGSLLLLVQHENMPLVDKMSGAFLSFMIGLVIITLIKANSKDDRNNSES